MFEFTNWTLLITIVHQFVVLWAASSKSHCFYKLSAVHLSFEACACFNFATATCYWVYALLIDPRELTKEMLIYRRIHAYNVHTLPTLAVLVNYFWLDIRIAFSHVKTWASFAAFYVAVNYY